MSQKVAQQLRAAAALLDANGMCRFHFESKHGCFSPVGAIIKAVVPEVQRHAYRAKTKGLRYSVAIERQDVQIALKYYADALGVKCSKTSFLNLLLHCDKAEFRELRKGLDNAAFIAEHAGH